MSKRLLNFYIIFLLIFISCVEKTHNVKTTKWKREIIDTEIAFCKMAAERGIKEAFLFFAADNAVLERNNKLIRGKAGISQNLSTLDSLYQEVFLDWKPDFADVSSSGDLGYTYGRYTIHLINFKGDTIKNKGIFHTVWKKQTDGTWKYVWD